MVVLPRRDGQVSKEPGLCVQAFYHLRVEGLVVYPPYVFCHFETGNGRERKRLFGFFPILIRERNPQFSEEFRERDARRASQPIQRHHEMPEYIEPLLVSK